MKLSAKARDSLLCCYSTEKEFRVALPKNVRTLSRLDYHFVSLDAVECALLRGCWILWHPAQVTFYWRSFWQTDKWGFSVIGRVISGVASHNLSFGCRVVDGFSSKLWQLRGFSTTS
jgi:hypothetical protein